jgi:dolichol-phosphate mannosyltransferase
MNPPSIPYPRRRRHDAGQLQDLAMSYATSQSSAADDPSFRNTFQTLPDARTTENARSWALGLIVCYGIFHLFYSSIVGLAGDEAYYWQWSRQLDWGYYDHPPMIAYLISLGQVVAGPGELGVRFMSVLLSSATLWVVYRLATSFAAIAPPLGSFSRPDPATAGLWAVISLIAAPMFGIGGFLATPDIPMIFFWTLSIALTWRAIQHPTTLNWILVGLSLGLGLISKYSMVVLPVALLVAFAVTHHGRRLLLTRGPWMAASAALFVCIPHFLWLSQHDFVSIQFQLGHGLGSIVTVGQHSYGWNTFVQFVAGQAGVISPPLFMLFLWAITLAAIVLIKFYGKRHPHGAASEMMPWLIVVPAALTLLVFALASFFSKSQTNWPAAAYTTLSVVLGFLMASWTGTRGTGKTLTWAAVGLAMLITAYAHVEAAFPSLPVRSSVFDKLQEKRSLAQWLDLLRSQSESKQSATVLADNYRLASLLAFYLADRPQTDAPSEAGSGAQYVLWQESRHSTEKGMAWYLTRFENDPRMSGLFQNYRLQGAYVEKRAGIAIGITYAYFGRLIRKPSAQSTTRGG